MNFTKFCKRLYSLKGGYVPQVCIVGSGPAGFYSAQNIVKNIPNVQVDIYERLPVPFGLVRFGVAPDHPEVKNVINTFTKTAQHPNVRFIGNVNLGTDITLKDLQRCYNVVLLTYGADEDKNLGIPGEDLKNVLSARKLVGWYNGLPSDVDFKVDLTGQTVAIIGQGNVAIDVARILLTPIDILKKTDITQYALETLSSSQIKKVYLIGRRGPLQAAFTIKELREMLKLPGCSTYFSHDDFNGLEDLVKTLPRPRKRINELMLSSLKETKKDNPKSFIPKFYRSPLKFNGTEKVSSILLGINKLQGDDLLKSSAVLTDEREELNCDLAIRSIGYKSIKADDNLPFDEIKGVVPNEKGKVNDGLYTTGWLGTGPTGVILTTMSNSFETAHRVCTELLDNKLVSKPGFSEVKTILENINVPRVFWNGWVRIDKHEQEIGKVLGKPREKITSVEKMLEIGGENI